MIDKNNVKKATDIGRTPLSDAAASGHEEMVRALIEAGADENKANNNGYSPLYWAAHQGHEAVVQALIETGADVHKAGNISCARTK